MTHMMTIGYEGASLEDFIATLRIAGVKRLVDIRELPQSRRPGFSKNALAQALEASGIEYSHLKALGDPKHGRDAARAGRMDEFRQIYNAHIERPEGVAALKIAADMAKQDHCALLCYERNPQDCHRSIVAHRLSGLYAFEIKHLGVQGGAAKQFRQPELADSGLSAR